MPPEQCPLLPYQSCPASSLKTQDLRPQIHQMETCLWTTSQVIYLRGVATVKCDRGNTVCRGGASNPLWGVSRQALAKRWHLSRVLMSAPSCLQMSTSTEWEQRAAAHAILPSLFFHCSWPSAAMLHTLAPCLAPHTIWVRRKPPWLSESPILRMASTPSREQVLLLERFFSVCFLDEGMTDGLMNWMLNSDFQVLNIDPCTCWES